MKVIILQDIAYHDPEGVLGEYHGAIWAEEFQRRGMDATKMVLGDPTIVRPISSLLSVSTREQRLNPEFWHDLSPDIVLYYATLTDFGIQVLHAIRTGCPKSFLVARYENVNGPERLGLGNILRFVLQKFKRHRYSHFERHDNSQLSVVMSLIYAVSSGFLHFFSNSWKKILPVAETVDAITYYSIDAVTAAKESLARLGHSELIPRIHWMGYPLRPSFCFDPRIHKSPHSVAAIANWTPAKDPNLTAQVLVDILRTDAFASVFVAGRNSEDVVSTVLREIPEARSRIEVHGIIPNHELAAYLNKQAVVLACSQTEGYCSLCVEAMACGCSLVLTSGPGVRCFRQFADSGCAVQSASRSSAELSYLIREEFSRWDSGSRSSVDIARRWSTSRIDRLVDEILSLRGKHEC